MERVMEPGESIRSKCGKARIKYDPEWSPTLPYCLYVRGTAVVNKGTLDLAVVHMRRQYGYNILTTKTPVEKTS